METRTLAMKMGGVLLESVDEERDLSVIVQKSLKEDKHCAKAVK